MADFFICSKLVCEFEKDRKVSEVLGSLRHCTPTGDPYVTLSGFGGADDARAAFIEYAKDRRGVLHWRTKPEISALESNTEAGETFYMRLFIEP